MPEEILVKCFLDTLTIANGKALRKRTEDAKKSNTVYFAGYRSQKRIEFGQKGKIIVDATTTFRAAKMYRAIGKTAVLNFANPEMPGGGVRIGAMAQEECLCRSSNLYPCLCDENVFASYYKYHRELHSPFYSDRLIYTKDVTVFKDDGAVPKLMAQEEWFTVDVITCAAPYLAAQKTAVPDALKTIFKSRIQNIFEAALDNCVQTLILGAFGCGAFHNPPEIVAQAFYETIEENHYLNYFPAVVFATKPDKQGHNLFCFAKTLLPGKY